MTPCIIFGKIAKKLRELAKKIGIDEALVSKIVRYHIEEFSLDRLYDFLNTLDPGLTLKVARKKDEAA